MMRHLLLRRRQGGQAMIEMVAMGGIASLLFLSIWFLGKYHDIQSTAIQAARYSAWERTVHSPAQLSDAKLQSQTRARLFTFNQQAYLASDSKANGAAWGKQNPNWVDHSGTKRLVDLPDDVLVSTSAEGLPTYAAGTMSKVFGMVSKVGAVVTGGQSLTQGGMYTGTVTVAVKDVINLPAPLNALNLKLTERSTVVTDNWDANGPQQAAARTKPFAPVTALTQANMVIGPVTDIISLIEPSMSQFEPGRVCPDIIPNDRTENHHNLPAYGGAQPCF